MAYTDIDKPSDYFETVLYTGTGSTQSITSLDFQPDWVWGKTRNDTQDHQIIDSVRGATKLLATNGTAAEFTDTNNLTSFNSNGFTVGSSGGINGSSDTLVTWCWKAGTSVSGNTGGSGTAKSYSGSVNTDAGFSITSFTGNGTIGHTIPHSLNAIPSMFIIKKYGGSGDSTARDWDVYHQSLGNTKVIFLNTTAANSTSSEYWNDTTPTSSVITLGANDQINGNNNTYICYAFSEKKGYSKFGSYVGNGNADGTFVYTGQKSAFIMVKSTGGESNWQMSDNKRNTFNEVNKHLRANSSGAEFTNYPIDFLSNGFKLRATDTDTNGSGTTYIFMAFAENPFTTSTGVPATAR